MKSVRAELLWVCTLFWVQLKRVQLVGWGFGGGLAGMRCQSEFRVQNTNQLAEFGGQEPFRAGGRGKETKLFKHTVTSASPPSKKNGHQAPLSNQGAYFLSMQSA